MKNRGGYFSPELGFTLNWNWVVNITGICNIMIKNIK
ncbi:hypothetical protein BC952_2542 [Flavobacterium limicola]|uniref:Uncharacterized protein n=1 Tax=Flavobacterium limicola TaxID=180441 RepID=A0A495RYJ3_9FLAO|nr:hypothetical protein BC952_2542 [Flavobacterium limicola]